jgi:RimJ/RimL family protein N-acetyltransferase
MPTEPALLYALRLRTPRLELRLGTREELLELGRLAERGVHRPGEMPFAVPWTDRIGAPGFRDEFVAFHEQALAGWSRDGWTLNLIAFHDGAPIGSQTIGARRFAVERLVTTGSWLGLVHQGRGLGTEMRAAVLELAFGCLGAVAAVSGWLESGAGQSAGVSAKLGYRETGTHVESPRGEPVVHHDVRLERAEWRCPIEVEMEGVAPCLPLFGLDAS